MTIRVWHRADYPDAYPITNDRMRLVLKVDRDEPVKEVHVIYGDKYETGFPNRSKLEWMGDDKNVQYYAVDIDVPTHRLKYQFELRAPSQAPVWFGESGFMDDPESGSPFFKAYLCARDIYTIPAWVNHSICYQIFPERFANGNDALTPLGAVDWDDTPTPVSMHGGDLPGITQKLDYLADLGVNLLYLTPIFKAGSNHKYDTEDYFQIDPQFGTVEDLRTLVRSAHKLGIRVMLDAVFNHCGFRFAPFQDVIKRGKASRYWDWFFVEGSRVDVQAVNYETFAIKSRYMPKLNIANPEVEQYFLKVAAYWIETCDIDGWRLDVANEIDHVFWRRFRETVKQIKPDALIVGEIWHDSSAWLRGDQFDSVMNYPFREHVLDLFIHRRITPSEFARRMTTLRFQYPRQANLAMLNLLGSHDTERLLTLAEGDIDAVVMAMVYQLTAPGIPMIYYGDEIGMEGGPDPLCRAGMRWSLNQQHQPLRRIVKHLTDLRKSEPALQGEQIRFERMDRQRLCFARVSDDGAETVYVQFNFAAAEDSVPMAANRLFECTLPLGANTPSADTATKAQAGSYQISIWK